MSEGRLGDVQPLQVGQILAEEDPALEVCQSGVGHVEDLGVGVHSVREGGVQGAGAVHSYLARSPETLAVVRTQTGARAGAAGDDDSHHHRQGCVCGEHVRSVRGAVRHCQSAQSSHSSF